MFSVCHGNDLHETYPIVTVSVCSGIDIKDIPQVNDQDFSITLNGFFLVRWVDERLKIKDVTFGAEGDDLVPVDISLVSEEMNIQQIMQRANIC